MLKITILLGSVLFACNLQARVVVTGKIVERDGITRRATILEQAIPVQPMSEDDVRELSIVGPDGTPLPGSVEAEAHNQDGKVNWLRLTAKVAMPASGRLPVSIQTQAPLKTGKFEVRKSASRVTVETANYRLALTDTGEMELASNGRALLSGAWSVDLRGDARAVLWGSGFRQFVSTGVEVEEQSPSRATILLKAFMPVNERKGPRTLDLGRRFDFELRLFVNAFTPNIRFAWRMTNQLGHKTWLRRYALRLPLAGKATLIDGRRPGVALVGVGASRLAVTADFIQNLGKGAGMALTEDARSLLHGGIDMPPDGGYYSGQVPDIHCMFHNGMSRTFAGTIIPDGSISAADEALAPVDIVLPAQYYSDVKALPEAGDPVTFGEFETQVKRAAEWLLKSQWRGTLWWGEWYREWDETRRQGVQEASNGHSPLAPLYHYWRTGDARFLRCAERSAWYVWDVQLKKSKDGPGLMFHTRRHLFDELNWVHPRYQRATGGLIASHIFLNAAGRKEILQTIRAFHDTVFRDGVPLDWDLKRNRLTAEEDGPDVSNFMEALTYCYRETGDRYFLDAGLKMSRWSIEQWRKQRTTGKPWNWNGAQYVQRGLVTLYEASGDPRVRDAVLDLTRMTLASATLPGQEEARRTTVGDELHFAFYHSWISTRVAKFAPDGDEMIRTLLRVVRREVNRQRPDGQFSVDHGMESGLPTIWTSYYEAKSLVAYVPVLTAHMAGTKRKP
jgi:hypothetical protein